MRRLPATHFSRTTTSPMLSPVVGCSYPPITADLNAILSTSEPPPLLLPHSFDSSHYQEEVIARCKSDGRGAAAADLQLATAGSPMTPSRLHSRSKGTPLTLTQSSRVANTDIRRVRPEQVCLCGPEHPGPGAGSGRRHGPKADLRHDGGLELVLPGLLQR